MLPQRWMESAGIAHFFLNKKKRIGKRSFPGFPNKARLASPLRTFNRQRGKLTKLNFLGDRRSPHNEGEETREATSR